MKVMKIKVVTLRTLFLDASALAKRYMKERGSDWIRQQTAPIAGNIITIAETTPIEVAALIMQRQREKNIPEIQAQPILALLRFHKRQAYNVLRFHHDIEATAYALVLAYGLRASEAIQLASALTINSTLVYHKLPPLVFLSTDTQLLAVAAEKRLQTDDPNQHL